MKTLLRSFLTIAFMLPFAFSIRAQTTPVPSARYLAAQRAGEEDAKRGIYLLKRLGLIPPSVGNRPSKKEFYQSILADRYHIITEKSIGCILSEGEVDEVYGYNAGMRAGIEAVFGEGFFERVEREADAEWEQRYGEQKPHRQHHVERPTTLNVTANESARAQNAGAASQVPSPAQTELKPPAKRKFDYPAKLQTTYDAAKDQSMVFFPLLAVKALETPVETYEPQISDERLAFSAYFVYPGRQLATPHWVNLAFLSHTENPQKYKDHLLRIKADDQWLELGAMKVLSTTNYSRRGQLPLTAQTMELPISYEQFLQLANAKKLKVKLGSVEFSFEKAQLEGIRDLAAHTVP